MALTSSLLLGCGTRGNVSLGLKEVTAPDESGSNAAATSVSEVGGSDGTASDASESGSVSATTGGSDFSSTSGAPPDLSGLFDGGMLPSGAPCSESSLLPLPVQRFDFSGNGSEVVDLMGGPSGTLRGGARLDGQGTVQLDGDDDYVDLPNGLLGNKLSATLVVWVSLHDGPAYWRLLDFGTGSAGEDPTGSSVGTTYVAITTETGLDPDGLALLIGHGGASAEDRALTSVKREQALAALSVVLNGETSTAELYVDGERAATTSISQRLNDLNDVNNWLGRSQYSADPNYPGTYSELRVYSSALSECEVQQVVSLGPDSVR